MGQFPAKSGAARWAVILAGGNGSRLLPLTRALAGREIPKQFCPLLDGRTLLEQTRRRVALTVAPSRTMVVVSRRHEQFYGPLLADLPCGGLLAQPDNRGTGAAIVYALLRLSQQHPDGRLAFFPSDHYVDDNRAFMHHVQRAFDVVDVYPHRVVILGIAPDSVETSYGWIVPGSPLPEANGVFTVARFVEKPAADVARQLWRQRGLWNSFVMVARISTMLAMVRQALPKLWLAFEGTTAALGTPREQQAIEELYAGMEETDFSRQALPSASGRLAVLPVNGVTWSDLGEPQRVCELFARFGSRVAPAATKSG